MNSWKWNNTLNTVIDSNIKTANIPITSHNFFKSAVLQYWYSIEIPPFGHVLHFRSPILATFSVFSIRSFQCEQFCAVIWSLLTCTPLNTNYGSDVLIRSRKLRNWWLFGHADPSYCVSCLLFSFCLSVTLVCSIFLWGVSVHPLQVGESFFSFLSVSFYVTHS